MVFEVFTSIILSKLQRKASAPGRSHLTARQQAVLAYTDAMTEFVTVSDNVFQQLVNAELSNREIVEPTTTVAGYNCVSRILVALDVGENNFSRDEECRGAC